MTTQNAVSRPNPTPFACGTGVIRSKPTRDAVMYFGRMTLPVHGEVYVRGHRDLGDKEMRLELQHAQTRAIVATLSLPVSTETVIEGKVRVGRKVYALRAELRQGEAGPYRALRLPEVKIAGVWA